ncbi:hypothetical protein H112_06017 [Trichophyton rubrum D6]|uniref:Uncharacterized protein n=1 Tax=Trichophyton rubrum CBS 288.86 TaxID=1215330 RepID=A0A022VX25_TRIRU|nr:hypothetical protein H100_06031 [Trichophyton rubrum MR850]EZF39965.1 hypothetical protein H102_06000 [Trichophyton rubrum CBS 100081]EZF50605.1 hypothetical protein H103_06025 [Trichophyton rubrum CBS 288.86]EZF61149.1 hypothetical protein H104_06013 [Trichophyton rubrum CBS 289.86]EZF82365.1 hypothetical protein H110_06021 [Trichophyton rubrum MR1448]EZF93042.1 hypothetical protein H113_06069 [Trichophyton rubrum MR1459]EZG14717.1 hypothetical protein H107_06162 [Trichophyton rubrum CBS 
MDLDSRAGQAPFLRCTDTDRGTAFLASDIWFRGTINRKCTYLEVTYVQPFARPDIAVHFSSTKRTRKATIFSNLLRGIRWQRIGGHADRCSKFQKRHLGIRKRLHDAPMRIAESARVTRAVMTRVRLITLVDLLRSLFDPDTSYGRHRSKKQPGTNVSANRSGTNTIASRPAANVSANRSGTNAIASRPAANVSANRSGTNTIANRGKREH